LIQRQATLAIRISYNLCGCKRSYVTAYFITLLQVLPMRKCVNAQVHQKAVCPSDVGWRGGRELRLQDAQPNALLFKLVEPDSAPMTCWQASRRSSAIATNTGTG
jgi:hypothetical protein